MCEKLAIAERVAICGCIIVRCSYAAGLYTSAVGQDLAIRPVSVGSGEVYPDCRTTSLVTYLEVLGHG